MKVRIAYLEEPPFYWTAEDGSVKGADIELAEVVLRAAGVSAIEYQRVPFDELLRGVQEDRWDMNVPIFVTAERAGSVAFSAPVWALGDGLLLRHGNPKVLTSYGAVAARNDARLGVVAGTVQLDAAKSAGVSDSQIVAFKDQPDAIDALLSGTIDAYASTAVGSRALASANPQLEVAALEMSRDGRAPVGAFSFSKRNPDLLQAVNEQLRQYLGSDDHRARMAKYGLTRTELDGVSAA
ncbi:transporter substrate-binding domain-containing protein [Paraburkholderia phosphatilytica]|uniref:transporter substrate-binding domain-containing protein n=1 Tax=Paraburkholderia phosphatilytica TaxID=2282883 RepID=UPI000E55534D|nr:transporter substrate-binding domain-containing protein [Paraburkholderia phosphatilytica]